jgi:methylmalonyl-CoA/ethylmalonyl-CoA epimerase
MQHVEHIGIAVKNLAASIPLFEKLFNTKCYKTELVENENVNTAFLKGRWHQDRAAGKY